MSLGESGNEGKIGFGGVLGGQVGQVCPVGKVDLDGP